MRKEQRYEIRYIGSNGEEKVCIPKSTEAKDKQLEVAKAKGIKIVSVKKMYPFSMARNQHNLALVSNRCFNIMCEMECGDRKYDEAEYDRLERMKERADELFVRELPVAWMTWEDLKDAKELSAMAINMRAETCVAKGRPDLVVYCAL